MNKISFSGLLFCCLVSISDILYGQAFRVLPLLEKSALYNPRDIFEQTSGMVWIATDSGLLRVVGNHVSRIDSQACHKIIPYHDAVIVIGNKRIVSYSQQGLVNDDPFLLLENTNVQMSDIIDMAAVQEDSSLWILTEKRLFLIQNERLFEPVLEDYTNSYQKVLMFVQNGMLHIVTPEGFVFVWHRQTMKFKRSAFNTTFIQPEKFVRLNDTLRFILDQHIIFALSNDLKVTRVAIPEVIDGEITDISPCGAGLLIGTSHSGLWLCKPTPAGLFIMKVLNGNDPHRIVDLPFSSIHTVVHSENDNILVLADGQAWLMKLRPFQRFSVDVPMYTFEKNALLDNGTIYLDGDGSLWECHQNKNGEYSGRIARIGLPSLQACITAYQNTLWISTMEDDVFYYREGKLNRVTNLKKRGGTIFNLFADSGGNVWLQQAPSVLPIVGTLRITRDLKVVEYGASKGFKSRMLAAKEAPDGTIYFCGIGETSYLYRYDGVTDSVINLSVPMSFDYGESFEVHDLAIGADSVIWLASTSGLLRYKNKKIERVDIKGLKDYEAVGLAIDPDGALWVATYTTGVIRVRDSEFTIFDQWAGLVTNLQSYRSLRTTADGIVWIGTREGFMISTPGQHREQQTKMPVMLSVSDETEQERMDGNEFSYNSTLRFSFISPTYPVKTVRYAYRLVGMNESWVDMLQGDSLILNNLKEGNYTLEVKALQAGGYFWSAPMMYSFSVNRVWYLQAWALASFVILIGGTGAAAVVLYNRHLRLENERLERKVSERTTEIALKNEEISAQNEEITSQMEEISSQMDQVKKMNEEIASQRDYSNQQRELITKQNQQLADAKSQLEEKVKERTSELSRSHQELMEHNVQLEQFAFMTAHNLRAPVARLIGLTALFNHKQLSDPVNSEVIQFIHESAKNLDEIIRDIATILRVKKSLSEKMEPVLMSPVLQKVLVSFQQEIHSKKIAVYNKVESNTTVLGIEPYVYSVIYNIISNTIKYSDERKQAQITIESSDQNGVVKLIFKDNGIGFDSNQYREKLFKPFSRLNATVDGKGLGLYLIKIEMESMHGNVEIESKPNIGTTTTLTFQKALVDSLA
jgi:signal transduction histidine kinase/ligand-binding sensor domain-containing protein